MRGAIGYPITGVLKVDTCEIGFGLEGETMELRWRFFSSVIKATSRREVGSPGMQTKSTY